VVFYRYLERYCEDDLELGSVPDISSIRSAEKKRQISGCFDRKAFKGGVSIRKEGGLKYESLLEKYQRNIRDIMTQNFHIILTWHFANSQIFQSPAQGSSTVFFSS